jgi:imidazolonepropionase
MIEGDRIAAYGEMKNLEVDFPNLPTTQIDMKGGFVLPTWVDSHTHIVFAGSRENEFVDKIQGLSYAEIAGNGGGILNSAAKLNEATADDLFLSAWNRLSEVAKLGTGAIEIKSGYGLSVESELKMLRVIKKLKEKSNLLIKSTFLGAHSFPQAYKENHHEYIRIIIEEMLPIIGKEQLADYIDVFCENGFFNVEEMERICNEGKKYGLLPKLHINQLNSIGGIQSAIKMDAVSVDHLETMTDKDIVDLSQSNTIGTLLPSAAFFLRMPYQPARELIDSNCAVALASDYNPGSSPSGNMNFIVALSCIQMKMLPEEAINASTINAAYAMQVQDKLGSITVGKLANLILTNPIPSIAYLPYSFGSNLIDKVIIKGEIVN